MRATYRGELSEEVVDDQNGELSDMLYRQVVSHSFLRKSVAVDHSL